MSSPLDCLDEESKDRARRCRQPEWTDPMKATLCHEPFFEKGWLYEWKLDGERCIVVRKGRSLRLYSRNQKELNQSYPELAEALRKQCSANLIADGEIVAFSHGVTSFSRLQQRMQIKDAKKARESNVAVYLYLFDLIHCDGCDLSKLPLTQRKKVLKQAVRWKDPVRFCRHRMRNGEALFKRAARQGREGLIAKRTDGTYRHKRSKDWLKFKCSRRQEFVIGGYTDPQGERTDFGALLIGYYRRKKLVYAGQVGTGFDEDLLQSLGRKLRKLEEDRSPFAVQSPSGKSLHWVRPRLVGEVEFTEWTEDGKLRHPRFLGLRRDKKPTQVVRESTS